MDGLIKDCRRCHRRRQRMARYSENKYNIIVLFRGYPMAVFISATSDNCPKHSREQLSTEGFFIQGRYEESCVTTSLSYDRTYLFANELITLSAIILY